MIVLHFNVADGYSISEGGGGGGRRGWRGRKFGQFEFVLQWNPDFNDIPDSTFCVPAKVTVNCMEQNSDLTIFGSERYPRHMTMGVQRPKHKVFPVTTI